MTHIPTESQAAPSLHPSFARRSLVGCLAAAQHHGQQPVAIRCTGGASAMAGMVTFEAGRVLGSIHSVMEVKAMVYHLFNKPQLRDGDNDFMGPFSGKVHVQKVGILEMIWISKKVMFKKGDVR